MTSQGVESDWHSGSGDGTIWHWKQRLWSRFPDTEEMSKEERDLVCEGIEPPNTSEAQVRLSRVLGN